MKQALVVLYASTRNFMFFWWIPPLVKVMLPKSVSCNTLTRTWVMLAAFWPGKGYFPSYESVFGDGFAKQSKSSATFESPLKEKIMIRKN
jgi:hypothetical protein